MYSYTFTHVHIYCCGQALVEGRVARLIMLDNNYLRKLSLGTEAFTQHVKTCMLSYWLPMERVG